MHPLLFLSLCQIKNAFRASLRNPVVWIPILIIVLLIPTRIGAFLTQQDALPAEFGQFLGTHLESVHAGIFVILALLALGYLDAGLAGGALRFIPADVAFLFPAAFSRRLVLFFKLPAAMSSSLGMVVILSFMFQKGAWSPLQEVLHKQGGAGAALAATALCVFGFLNLSVALDVVLSKGRSPWMVRFFRTVCVGGVVGAAWFLSVHGLCGLSALAQNPLVLSCFYPCHAAADVVMSRFQPAPSLGVSWLALVCWYGLTLAILLTQRTNYYEAAALGAERAEKFRTAMRRGDWAATGAEARRSHHFSFPKFGRGIGAVVWVHLTAAAKRPSINFLWPILGGIGIVLFVSHVGHSAEESGMLRIPLLILTAYYVLYGVALIGISFYQRSLTREALFRLLPLPMWAIVGADIATRSMLGSLFPAAEALSLLFLRIPETGTLSLLLLTAVPALILCFNILSCRLAVSYPNALDKVQTTASGFVQFLAYGMLAGVVAPFWVAPGLLHAPEWVQIFSVTFGLLIAAGLMFWNTVQAATVFEAAEDPPPLSVRQWARDIAKGMKSPPVKKSVKIVLIAGLGIAILGFAAARVNKAIHQPPAPPRTVQTRFGDMVIKVSETGTIQPVDKVNVESKAPGRLLSIPIIEGQTIQKGQLIAVVDRSQLDPQIAGLRAQLNQAEAHLQQTEAQYDLQVRQTHSAIAQAEANLHTSGTHLAVVAARARPQELAQQREAVARAQIALDDALRTQTRRQALLAKGYIPQADADAAQVTVDTARSSLDTAKQALALIQAGPRPQDIQDAKAQFQAQQVAVGSARSNAGQIAVSRAEISQARASVQQIQNQLAQLLVQLADTRILAPASGIVLKKYKQPNEIVQSATTGFSDAQSLVATLGSRLEVQVGINEVDIPKVRVGARVEIHVDALSNTVIAGHVTEVAPASTNAFSATDASGGGGSISKFNVKIALDSAVPQLRPGMTANVDIISARRPHVILAPLEAVPGSSSTATVTILSGKLQRKKTVSLGLRNDTDVEITHGLRSGESLVVPSMNGAGRRKFDVGN